MHIGIDLGGTNIAAALVDGGCDIYKRISMRTDTGGGASTVIDGLTQAVQILLDGSKILPESIGVGVPGSVNEKKGEVLFTPNLPISGVNIANELRLSFDCPVYLGNDANCAALGETIAGCARGVKDAVFITLGTGIGGAIILNGRLYTGFNGAASEVGHMLIVDGGRKCGCGRLGCWEAYASASGLIKTAIDTIALHSGSIIWKLCGNNLDSIDGQMIFDAYRKDDKSAQEIVGVYTGHLAAGVIDIINILEPELLCIAGGISNAWDCLEEPLIKLVDTYRFTGKQRNIPQTRIEKSSLGDDAGIIGAANLSSAHVLQPVTHG